MVYVMKNRAPLPIPPMVGVLEPYALDYKFDLSNGRYASSTNRAYLCCVGHFANWIMAEKIQLEAINDSAGRRFIEEHLPRCQCPPPRIRSRKTNNAALSLLYRIIRPSGAHCTSDELTPVREEMINFDRYMDNVRGLALRTRHQRVLFLTRFLTARFGRGSIVASAITAADIRKFVLDLPSTGSQSTGLARVKGEALRCYLQFRALAGDPVELLEGMIPRPANRRLAKLPVTLSKSEITQLLASSDESLPSARRDYAILRCLADLGLRGCEVLKLTLSDIDWRDGTLRIAKGKSRRTDILPLLFDTGRAIAEYLSKERPATSSRALFVRCKAPFDKPLSTTVVHNIVKAAYRRCGWSHTRPHILRHSVASQLLRDGAPLKEISDVLRHRSLNTSMVYLKVDADRLAAVALPWPGRIY